MVTEKNIQEYLEKIVASNVMGRSARRKELLDYLIRTEVDGDGDGLKAYSIGLDVFGKPEDFDPTSDSSVRVEVGRLRTAIALFEASEHATTSLVVEIPVGTYRPKFSIRPAPKTNPSLTNIQGDERSTAQVVATADAATGHPLLRKGVLVGALLSILAVALLTFLTGGTVQQRDRSGRVVELFVEDFTGNEVGKSIATLIKSGFANSSVVALQNAKADTSGQLSFRVRGSVTDFNGVTVINTEILNDGADNVVWSKALRLSQGEDLAEKITQSVSGELHTRLFGAVKRELEKRNPADLTVEQLFILATWVSGPAVNSMEWETERVQLMNIALEKDPDFGPAHSVLADKYGFLANVFEPWDTKENRERSMFHADRAAELSPSDADAMFNVAQSHWHAGRMEQSQRIFKRVTELDSSNNLAQFFAVVVPYWCSDVPDDIMNFAIEFDKNLSADDPIRWIVLTWIATLHTNRNEYKEALKQATSAAQIFQVGYTYMAHAMLLNKLGMIEDATRVIQRQRSNWPNVGPRHYSEATVPRQCHEQSDPSRIIAHYSDLTQSTLGEFESETSTSPTK